MYSRGSAARKSPASKASLYFLRPSWQTRCPAADLDGLRWIAPKETLVPSAVLI